MTTSTSSKTMKVKRPKEGGFYVSFFGFCFVVGLFFPLHLCQAQKKIISKNLVITYKLSTIKGFCHKVGDFVIVLVFLNFCHGLKEIAKGKKKEIGIKECVADVNVLIHNGQLLTNYMFSLRFFV